MLEPTTRPSLDLEVSFNTVAVKDAAIVAIASSLRVLRDSVTIIISLKTNRTVCRILLLMKLAASLPMAPEEHELHTILPLSIVYDFLILHHLTER